VYGTVQVPLPTEKYQYEPDRVEITRSVLASALKSPGVKRTLPIGRSLRVYATFHSPLPAAKYQYEPDGVEITRSVLPSAL